VVAEVKIIITRPGKWRGNKMRPVKPIRIKGTDWGISHGALSVYDKNATAILSLGEGEWRKVRRG
jgi:hypothetical protein